MITQKTPMQIKSGDTYHNVTVLKSVGTFEEGRTIPVEIMRMSGRIYKEGKDKQGKFIDTVGVPDTRFMVFGADGYACVSEEEMNEAFQEV
jgi:hypothetical protein